jgi:hypothetical protein
MEKEGKYVAFKDKGLNFYHNAIGLYISGSTRNTLNLNLLLMLYTRANIQNA